MNMESTARPPRSSIAAIAWGREGQKIVYWQDFAGWVRETRSPYGTTWVGGNEGSRLFRAKQGTPLAAVNWGSNNSIRIYYLDDENIIQEHCWDGSWYTGALGSKRIQVDPRSKLAAVCWSEKPQIRVYYQLPNNTNIQEQSWEGSGWENGATLEGGLIGTALAVAPFAFGDIAVLRLFYQGSDNRIGEHCWDTEEWKFEQHAWDAVSGTAIGTVSTDFDSKNLDTPCRVYFEKPDEKGIVEMLYNVSGGTDNWVGPEYLAPSLANTPLAVCAFGDQFVRIFYQPAQGNLGEFHVDQIPDQPAMHSFGSVVPTL